jgi:hypothetical protein
LIFLECKQITVLGIFILCENVVAKRAQKMNYEGMTRRDRLDALSYLKTPQDLQNACQSSRKMQLMACGGEGVVGSYQPVDEDTEVTTLRYALGEGVFVNDSDVMPELWAEFVRRISGISTEVEKCSAESLDERVFVSSTARKLITPDLSNLQKLLRYKALHLYLVDIQLNQRIVMGTLRPQYEDCRNGIYVIQSRDFSGEARRPPLLIVSLSELFRQQSVQGVTDRVAPFVVYKEIIGVQINGFQSPLQGSVVFALPNRQLSYVHSDNENLKVRYVEDLSVNVQTTLPKGSRNVYEWNESTGNPEAIELVSYIDGELSQNTVTFPSRPAYVGVTPKWFIWKKANYGTRDSLSFSVIDRKQPRFAATYSLRSASLIQNRDATYVMSHLFLGETLYFAIVFTTQDQLAIVVLKPDEDSISVREFVFPASQYQYVNMFAATETQIIVQIRVRRNQNTSLNGFMSFDIINGDYTSYASAGQARLPFIHQFDTILLPPAEEQVQTLRSGTLAASFRYQVTGS